MLKVGFISLGCAKNQVDLERLAGKLPQRHFEFTSDTSLADLMIINTCGFIRPAVEEAIDAVLTAKKQIRQGTKIIVFGCMVERYKDEIAKELPEIDFFAGVGEESSILSYIESVAGKNTTGKDSRYLFNPPYYAYLKISEGCNNRCSYCTIPSIRGNLLSVPKDEIIEEAKTLASGGAKEIIIISQDSTKYGTDLNNGYRLENLITDLSKTLPDTFFRIMYMNPDGVSLKLIDTIKNLPNVLKYFDIPVQHASDKMLKAMNRHSRSKGIAETFETIRREIPDAFIRTTMIVGFPGEDEGDFAAAKEFLTNYTPDFAGFFPYSPEDGTKAAAMADAPPAGIVKKRVKALQSIQKKNTLARLRKLKKDEIICYVEKPNEDFDFILEGRALFQAPEVDGQLYVIDGHAGSGYGPYRAKIVKIAYPDLYVKLLGKL